MTADSGNKTVSGRTLTTWPRLTRLWRDSEKSSAGARNRSQSLNTLTNLDVGRILLADLGGQEVVLSLEGDLLGVAAVTRLEHCLPAPAELGPREPVTEEHHLHAVLPALPRLVVPQVVHVDDI